MSLTRKTIEKDEEYLRQVSEEVDFGRDDVGEYIKDLKEYCSENTVYALSPVQIGIPKRIIYIKNTSSKMNNNYAGDYDENIVYINPKIIRTKGKTKFLEGCDSCRVLKENKTIYFAGFVERPYCLDISYQDIEGVEHTKRLKGFEATVFSHEFDHLNGVLHIDKVIEIFEMTLEEMRNYRNQNPYEIISKE